MPSSSSSSITVGLLCAVGSAVFNGSFTSLFKTDAMQRLQIHPMVFQLYVCGGIFVSSWFVAPFIQCCNEWIEPDASDAASSLEFSFMGLLAGFLFVLAVSCSFLAVQDIGVALAQGIWGGGAMLVSYLWGRVVFGEVPEHSAVSFLGLLVLITGVLILAFSERIGQRLFQHRGREESTPLVETSDEGGNASSVSPAIYLRGILWACSVGFFGGSILAPQHYVPPSQQGLVFLPSFGMGAMILSPMVFFLYLYVTGESTPPFYWRQALATGLCSGLVWNAGNLLSMVAIPAIGYGVAYPIMQCAILVSGMWGILVFREITNKATITVYWMGGAILVLGGALLAVAQS